MIPVNFYKELSNKDKEDIYVQLFSLGTNVDMDLDKKLELLRLICYLTQQMKKRFPDKYRKPIDVLQNIYNREFTSGGIGEDSYLIALSIICDDLMYGINEISKPSGFSNAKDICIKIKELADQWMPF